MTMMATSTPLVILGMHRSGTSILAKWLHESGINMGDNLLAANRYNAQGYYEDKDILNFHEKVLRKRNLNTAGIIEELPDTLSKSEKSRFDGLLDKKSERTNWGWKEPRTSLFLEHLQDRECNYIFIFRHYEDVVQSLIKRRKDVINKRLKFKKTNSYITNIITWPHLLYSYLTVERRRSIPFLKAWILYNKNIEALYKKQQDQCLKLSYHDLFDCDKKLRDFLRNRGYSIDLKPSKDYIDQERIQKRNIDIKLNYPESLKDEADLLYDRLMNYYKSYST